MFPFRKSSCHLSFEKRFQQPILDFPDIIFKLFDAFHELFIVFRRIDILDKRLYFAARKFAYGVFQKKIVDKHVADIACKTVSYLIAWQYFYSLLRLLQKYHFLGNEIGQLYYFVEVIFRALSLPNRPVAEWYR